MGLFDWLKKKTSKPSRQRTAVPKPANVIETWRRMVVGDEKSWVLFAHGTCAIIVRPEADLRAQALELMRQYGPVHAGSPAGDFSVVKLTEAPGWVVTCHHNDILTYVAPDELSTEKPDDLVIGLLGRSKRDRDASELRIIHVEDRHHAG